MPIWLFKKIIWTLIKNKVNIYNQQLNFWLNNWCLHNWQDASKKDGRSMLIKKLIKTPVCLYILGVRFSMFSMIISCWDNVCSSYFAMFWYWATKQQTSGVIAPWWLCVSLWRICITSVWPRSTFCINKTVPGFLDVIPFQSLDVSISVV